MATGSENKNSATDLLKRDNIRIGDLLLERGLISQDQIDQALTYQKKSNHTKLLGEILVELSFVDQEDVIETLAQTFGVPFARVNPRLADPNVAGLLPREFLEKQLVLPLFLVNQKLTVAVHEPSNVFLIEEIERITGHQVQIVAATAKDIRTTLDAHLPSENVFVIDDVVTDLEENDLTLVERQVTDVTDLESAANDSPVIKVVNYLIFSAAEEGASDIHIEPDENVLRVRFRVDGRLYEKIRPPYNMTPAVVSRIKIMGGMDISERRLPQDGGITVKLSKHAIDLRVSTIPSKFGEKVVMRLVDNRNARINLDSIGFSYTMLGDFRKMIHQPNGVVLVTGPTGSGKSTTLYAALNEINSEDINISTVEDPVENNIVGVNQFQTNEKAGFTFADALRALLRQDPDVIMVGEIRDQETARIATQAALTGHLVFSPLHTNDAPSAVTRLFNMGVEPYLVAAAIRGVLAQRLVRKICSNCKESAEITEKIAKTLEHLFPGGSPMATIYHGTGCPKCHNTGHSGRLGIYELFLPDDEILDAITRGASLQELRRLARASGAYTELKDDGLEKVQAGLTSIDQLMAIAVAG